MEDSKDGFESETSTARLGRRRFMVRAAVAGTAAFAVPMIVTMSPAGAAQLTSPPPTPPEVEGGRVIDRAEVEVRSSLPATGAPIDTFLGAGAAALVGGGALQVWSARAAHREAGPADTPAPSTEGPADVSDTIDPPGS